AWCSGAHSSNPTRATARVGGESGGRGGTRELHVAAGEAGATDGVRTLSNAGARSASGSVASSSVGGWRAARLLGGGPGTVRASGRGRCVPFDRGPSRWLSSV